MGDGAPPGVFCTPALPSRRRSSHGVSKTPTRTGKANHERRADTAQRQHRCERPARVVGISPATQHATSDQPMGVPPPPRLWGHAYCRWRCRGRCGHRVPFVRCLRMGSLLPGSCGGESRGWLLVPHYRSFRICPNLSLVRRPPVRRCRTRGSFGRWSPGTCRATGGLHFRRAGSRPRAPRRLEERRRWTGASEARTGGVVAHAGRAWSVSALVSLVTQSE
jgi:hypothetical protein